jgi:iron complex transport system permease protein
VWSAALLVLALGLLLSGLMQGSLPVPASAIGRALFFPQALNANSLYRAGYPLAAPADGVACGAMLGMAGAAMQSITRNGLADPGLRGERGQ